MELDPVDQGWIIEECLRFGQPLPDKIREAPELLPGLELYYRAFFRLSTCRQIGMGLGPVPWTAVQEYARVLELEPDQAEALRYHIERMDNAFLDWQSKKTE